MSNTSNLIFCPASRAGNVEKLLVPTSSFHKNQDLDLGWITAGPGRDRIPFVCLSVVVVDSEIIERDKSPRGRGSSR